MASGDTKTEALLRILGHGGSYDGISGSGNTKTQDLLVDAIGRIQNVEDDVEELKNNPDVVDIVDTYADLQAYDTSHLTDKDVIRVLADETHGGNSTYYRFTKNPDTWTFIGEVSGGDTVYSGKTTSNSATGGAVYIGNLDSSQSEQPDPTTTDYHYKYFWALPLNNTAKPKENSVCILGQTEGSGVAIGGTVAYGCKVLGYNGVAIGPDANSTQSSVAIGFMANASRDNTNNNSVIAIGTGAQVLSNQGITIGGGGSSYGVCHQNSTASVALGYNATIGDGSNGYKNAVALGAYSKATRQGEVNVGLVMGQTTGGYNNTAYRVIGGVHDPVDAHDAATKGYVDNLGGMTILYVKPTEYDVYSSTTQSGIHFYKEDTFTTTYTAEDIRAILYGGGNMRIVVPDSSDPNYIYKHIMFFAGGTVIDQNSLGANGMTVFFNYNANGDKVSLYLEDPTDTTFSLAT